jgi:hypothetical protein
MLERCSLSLIKPNTLSLSLNSLFFKNMASNDNDKCKMEEEAESSMARKHLWHTDDDNSDDDSSDSLEDEPPEEEPEIGEEEEEETEDEVSSEETSMNQLDSFEEKLYARHTRGILFKGDGDTPSTSSEPPPHRKVAGAQTRRAAMMMTMTSGCR